ncbi:unnamed protein product, partial [Allacma fusca]
MSEAQPDFFTHFQVALYSEKINSSTEGLQFFSSILDSEHNNSVLFLFAPTSVEDVYKIINVISRSISKGNVTEEAMYQRFSYILWPVAEDATHVHSKLQNDP